MKEPEPAVSAKSLVLVPMSLEAKTNKHGKVYIKGSRSRKTLPKSSPPHQFDFTLTDNTNLGVHFVDIDTEDDWPDCPPPGGRNSTQIGSITIAPMVASFVDDNSNTGAMDVCYSWKFACTSDPSQHPTFDPIIDNRGK